jgi:hypothetical protein
MSSLMEFGSPAIPSANLDSVTTFKTERRKTKKGMERK